MDLATVDTSFPIIKEGHYQCKVDKAEIVKTQKTQARMIKVELSTITPVMSRKGEQLGAGQKVFDQMMAEPTGKATWEQVIRSLGAIVQSAKLQGAKAANLDQWVPQLNGRIVQVNLGYEPAKDGYREKHVVLEYEKVA